MNIKQLYLFVFLYSIFLFLIFYFFNMNNTNNKTIIINNNKKKDILPDIDNTQNIYYPPLKNNNYMYNNFNINPTPCSVNKNDFIQIGILTNHKNKQHPFILPLMGRRLKNDKYQYYTISTNSNFNTKLPVFVNKKNGMNEYGCDEIYNNDEIYVQGYDDLFKSTIYANCNYSYII